MRPGKRTLGDASLKIGYSMAVPPHMRGKVRELSSLAVDQAARGKGAASALMAQTIKEADLNHMALLVVVEPFDDAPMDKLSLTRWYERQGFKPIQADPLVMVRPAH